MKKFFQHWKKVLSLLLVLVLVVQIVPTQVFAKEPDSAISEPETTIESESEQELETTPIGEVEELREEDVKHFMNTDGSFTAVKYAEPVHFKESEADDWEDIDNTLRLSNGETAKYTPKNSPIDVEFAEEFSKDKTVSVHSAGYELSWTYLQPDAEITDPIKEEVMSGNVAAETDITKTDNAETSASLPEIEKVVEAEKLDKFANNKIEDDITSFAALDNISDGLLYCDVFPNVDIEYILTSINLKENIVLKNNSAQNEFVAAYDIGSLSAEQIDDRNIELRDAEGNVVFCIFAPYMYDAKDEVNGDVVLSILSNSDGKLTVKITADKKWLQDESRAYPVKIDPDVLKAVQSFDQDATAIYKSISSSNRPYGTLVIGNDGGYSYTKAKAYVKFTLPTLGAGNVVVDGKLYIHEYSGDYGYSGSASSLQINAYRVTSSWTAGAIETSHGYSGLPSIDSTVIDYVKVGTQTRGQTVSLDVSKVAKMWYEGEAQNYGLCLRADDESAYALAQFVTSDNTAYPGYRPFLQVTYRSNKGLEGYWSNHEQNLGESGTGYVSDYTGNLVFVAPLLSTTGNIMPVSLSLIYNGYQHGSNIDRPNTVGEGWRLNIQQKLTPITDSGGLNSDLYNRGYRYIYSDSDGTDHYFMVDPHNSSKIIDEDGLGLSLTVKSEESDLEKYVIKSDSGGQMTFSSRGYLRKVYDDNGKYYKVVYSDNANEVGQIIRVEDGTGRKIEFERNSNGRINKIKQQMYADGSQPRTIELTYTDWDGLRTITYPGNRTTTFYYTDSGVKLYRIDAINGNSLVYAYPTSGDAATKSRVTGITEYSSYPNRVAGNSLTISYAGMNRTRFTDNKNRSETYQFDNFGKTVGIIDAAGNGSQYNYSNTSGKTANALKSTGVATKFVDNRLTNHSFENNSSNWDHESGISTVSNHYYYGAKSEKLSVGGYVSQMVSKDPAYTYYTSSVYARGSSNESKIKLNIFFYNSNGTYMTSKESVQDLRENTWERKQFTFSIPDGASSFRVRYVNCGNDDIWIDCAQLENGSTMNKYNMVQNGGFENTSSTAWEPINCSSGDNYYTNGAYGRHFYMSGDGSTQKRLIQKIYINQAANKVFLSVSGYAYAHSIPMDQENNRRFALSVLFHCTDGSEAYEYIPFNPDYSGGWQYASGTVGAKNLGSKTVDYAYIRCCYYNNANSVNFDRIQVNVDESGTSYTYDDDGNIISAKDNAGRHESYNYNNANDMTKLTSTDNKAYNFTYSDTYKHRMLSATSESSGVKYEYSYGTYGHADQGNVTGVKVSSTDSDYHKYIQQFTEYTEKGNYTYKAYSDRGYATTYDYGTYTGNLRSVKALKTSSSTENDATYYSTYYTYEPGTDRLKTVSDQENHPSGSSTVSYDYDAHGYLTRIATPRTIYTFTYDDFGNNLSTKVKGVGESADSEGRTLVTNTYAANNGLLTSQTYGNDTPENRQIVYYTYDDLDREKSRAYNSDNNIKFQWSYDADGNVGSYTDKYMNQKYTYTYDNIGRLVRTNVYDTSSASNGTEIAWFRTKYNDLDQSTSLHYEFNDKHRDVYFHYSSRDNLPLDVKFGTNSAFVVENNYDKLTRLKFKTYTITDSEQKLNTSYDYMDWSGENSDRTTGTVEGIDYTFMSGGLSTSDRWYTYDKAGNILTESIWMGGSNSNVLQENYTYDSKNQLIRHDSATQEKTFVYEYDSAGNITRKKEYSYTTSASLPNNPTVVEYGYSDGTWGDLLTSYGNQEITYDQIGNPTTYLGWNMTWQGRQLATASDGNTSLSYTYNADGIRTSKTVNTTTKTEYLLNGTQILAQKTGSNTLCFFYDQQGNRVGMADADNHFYYYLYNIQGDVIAIADAKTGKLVATYEYDAWGKCDVTNATGYTIGDQNPFRYRGYYYDTETGLYYLNSRYYDAETGRFINADAFASTDINGPLSANMFAYCENNPVMRCDPTGEIFDTVLDIISLASSISDVIANPSSVSCWLSLGADAVCLAIPGLSGGGIAVKALSKTDAVLDTAKAAYKVADKSSDIRKATGSYEIVFNSGKTYVGKGGYKRMLTSARNHGGDVKSLTWTKAGSHRQAYINEYKSMCKYGGPNNSAVRNKNSLNKIWSPGKHYYFQDYGRYYSHGGR